MMMMPFARVPVVDETGSVNLHGSADVCLRVKNCKKPNTKIRYG